MPRSLWWWESRGGRRRWPAPRRPAGCTWSWRWWRPTSSQMQVDAPGLRVGPLRGEVRRGRADRAGRARDRPLVSPVVPRRPEAAAGVQRRRPMHGHGGRLEAEAWHAVFQRAVVVAGALLVGVQWRGPELAPSESSLPGLTDTEPLPPMPAVFCLQKMRMQQGVGRCVLPLP